jgi:UDP-N-acetylglucosamine diphosphorylase/glucosamine-1-phosphate N-acetyltransferase
MKKRILLFVEGCDSDNFWPLCVSRPPYLLRCGQTLLWEKWVRRLNPADVYFYTRPELAAVVGAKTGKTVNTTQDLSDAEVWLLDGRWLIASETEFAPDTYPPECSLYLGDEIAGIRFDGADERIANLLETWLPGIGQRIPDAGLPRATVSGSIVKFPWDVVNHNASQIELDFAACGTAGADQWPAGSVHGTAVIQGGERVWIGKDAEIGPSSVIDARSGAIVISDNAKITPNSYIEGPAVIGNGSQVHSGRIRGGTTIGPQCRVGGEVEASVFLGFANKYHDGFFGHGIVGEWANLGAMTTNSDLKNNYGEIRVEMPGGTIGTGLIKVGSFLADHTKTGIGTLLPTGGTVGFAVNIFSGGVVARKMIPEFIWMGENKREEYNLAKAKGTAKEMYRRRGITFDELDAQLFDAIFEQTRQRRDVFLRGR